MVVVGKRDGGLMCVLPMQRVVMVTQKGTTVTVYLDTVNASVSTVVFDAPDEVLATAAVGKLVGKLDQYYNSKNQHFQNC